MKIALVHNFYPGCGGGEETVLYSEKAMLEKHGHDVVLFSRQLRDDAWFHFIHSALCLTWNPFMYRKMRRFLRMERPDLVHCHNTFPLISPSIYWACNREGVPVFQTLHNYRLICANAMFLRDNKPCELCLKTEFPMPAIRYRCYRNSLVGSLLMAIMIWLNKKIGSWKNRVSCFIALTDFSKGRFVESGIVSESKITVKPNFISDAYRDKAGEPVVQLPEKYCLFVGRLSDEKGVDVLISAWNAIEDTSGYQLLIVGDGPERQHLESLNKKSSAVFMGIKTRGDVDQLLKHAEFMVCPSIWYEGLPMTILEAFSHGTPVIASKLGNMEAMVEDQKTGLLFEAGCPHLLSDQIQRAITNEAEVKKMGLSAYEEYQNRYTEIENYRMLSQIYESRG
jgi:glycosyltransferase involved in cell wall biosynthesis